MPSVEIYTDGGCEPNPGPGGYGVVLLHSKKRVESSGGFRSTTNNRMEICTAIKGLELLKQPCKVTLYTGRNYYFEYYLYCPKCATAYHVEEAKRFVEQPPSLF